MCITEEKGFLLDALVGHQSLDNFGCLLEMDLALSNLMEGALWNDGEVLVLLEDDNDDPVPNIPVWDDYLGEGDSSDDEYPVLYSRPCPPEDIITIDSDSE